MATSNKVRARFTIAHCMVLLLFVSLGLGIHDSQERIRKLDELLSAWRRTEKNAFSYREWEPGRVQSAYFGPRYGLQRGSVWSDQDAWDEREYWVAVPEDEPHVIELTFFDWSDGSVRERFTGRAPGGRSLLRWDLQDCQLNKDMMVWIDDVAVIDVRVPIVEPARVCWNYQYCHPESDLVKVADGPIGNRLQVAAYCILPPPNMSANDAWMARLFEIRIRPANEADKDTNLEDSS